MFSHSIFPLGDFPLTVKACVEGLKIAIEKGAIDWGHFDSSVYEHYERVEYGDLNWVVDRHIVAFSGPHTIPEEINSVRTLCPKDYIPIFTNLNVGVVVRLNKPAYDSQQFTQHGIAHFDIYFPDGGLPECRWFRFSNGNNSNYYSIYDFHPIDLYAIFLNYHALFPFIWSYS